MFKRILRIIFVFSILCASFAHLRAEERFHGEPDSVTRPGERFKKPSMMISTDTLKAKSKKFNYEKTTTSVTVPNEVKPKTKPKSQSKNIKK